MKFTLPAGYYRIYDPVLLFTDVSIFQEYQKSIDLKKPQYAEGLDLAVLSTWFKIAEELKEHHHVIHDGHEIWGGLLPKAYAHPEEYGHAVIINKHFMLSFSGFIIITQSNVIRINRTAPWANFYELTSDISFDVEFNYNEGLIKMGPYEIK